MFNFMKKKKKDVSLNAICAGKVIPLNEVPDKVFANKLLGDGIGFTFEGDTLFSPCEGEITMVAQTKHAIGMTAVNGAELLIHCGLDTVNLNGKGLTVLVAQGEKVKSGQPLLKIDREFMNDKKICLTTPMILTNIDDYDLEILKSTGSVSVSDIVLKVLKK